MIVSKKDSGKPAGVSSKAKPKPVNLALQGGGAYGAFTWGVLDTMLTDNRVDVEAITATSAGAVNAVVMAYGLLQGGEEEARRMLTELWRKVSTAASMLPFRPSIADKLLGNVKLDFSPSFMMLDFITHIFSPYQFNLLDINPLRSILEEMVDFEAIRKNKQIKLFINATNVRTGKIRVFETKEISLDAVMASSCLPHIFKTVEIDGEAYWDGGYSGNPAIYPLIYKSACKDVVIVQINPLKIDDVPTQAPDILDRINEISFNATLMREMRAIAFVSKLLNQGKVKDNEYKNMRIHMIEGQELINTMGRSTKLNADWDFLCHLRDIGKQSACDWLDASYAKLGKESSIDIWEVFL